MSDRKNPRRWDRRYHRARRNQPSTTIATKPTTSAALVVWHVSFQRIT